MIHWNKEESLYKVQTTLVYGREKGSRRQNKIDLFLLLNY